MARGTQFLQLVTMLRNETGRASNVAVGVDDVSRLKHHLNRAYEQRYDSHDWPHLHRTFPAVPLAAGQRYYSFPADLNYDRIDGAWVQWDTLPVPLKRGITVDHYAVYDSAEDVRSAPATRWEVRSVGDATQFEIWPIPADNSQKVWFTGLRKIPRLVNDIDLCLLDDWLIVLDAAASLEKDKAKMSMRVAEAEARYRLVAANSDSQIDPVRLNLGPSDPHALPGTTIAVRAS